MIICAIPEIQFSFGLNPLIYDTNQVLFRTNPIIFKIFPFRWHFTFSDISELMTIQFWWHFSFRDIKFLGAINFWWNFSLSDILALVKLDFGDLSVLWHLSFSKITFFYISVLEASQFWWTNKQHPKYRAFRNIFKINGWTWWNSQIRSSVIKGYIRYFPVLTIIQTLAILLRCDPSSFFPFLF